VPDWDYFTQVVVDRQLIVDLDGLRRDCRLGEDAQIAGVITWHSSWTNLRGTGEVHNLENGENSLSVALPGEQLGGRLTLDARVLLHSNVSVESRISPHRRGSTLWVDTTRIDLEGAGARFPVVPVPFERVGLAGGRARAAWALVIESHDLAASGAGSLRLYVNSSHERVRRILEDPQAGDVRDLREMVHYDVARQLLLLALRHDDLEDGDAYEDGTLGSLLLGLLQRNFPERDLETLRGDLRLAPGELEAELQARMGFLAD
jgi:hypothetical protein